MDLNEAGVFVKVVQAGSFSQAARQLGMPNSTVSARVSALERRLGVTLLQRTTRRLRLTDAGETYFRQVLQGIEGILSAEAEVSAAREEPRGLLRVTAPVDMGNQCLLGIIPEFREKYPKVSLELLFTDQFVDLVAEGVDVAVRAGALKDSALVARRVGSACWAPFASPLYLKKAPAPSHPKELPRHELLQFTRLGTEYWRLFRGRSSVTVPLVPRLMGNDVNLIKALALSGHGIALLPTFICRAELKSGALQRVLPEWLARADPVHLVYPGQKFVPAKLRAFIDLAADRLKQLLEEQRA